MLVHLSDVKEKIRVRVADRLIRVGGLKETEAIDLKMAAVWPRQNPAIWVTADAARKVCG